MRLTFWLHQHLPQVWLQRGPLAWALRPLAAVYGVLMVVRRMAYAKGLFKTRRVPALVIVVGNVVAGGAGKTPVTIALAKHLLAKGFCVGVISRGHGRQTRDVRAVVNGSQARDVGDEPLLIHQATGVPVWVAPARADAAIGLLQAHPDVQILICDDGLQHLALARDLEICVMDERGIGNGWLLPAGPLREPWPRPVDWVLITSPTGSGSGAGPVEGYRATRQLADHAVSADGRLVPLISLKNQPLHAVAGLARPEAFFEMLRQSGLTLASTTALPDHHDYQDWPAATSEGKTHRRPGGIWLCSEKDAAKLWPHEPGALAVPLVITPESSFWTALDTRIRQLLTH
ncbi:tetraacyldisaccharide 4'-kinase [Limnohabitans sp. 2KL-17]|uniref:tetraacyldisaccharide 4'-kinase n=1 Tax=Limnohabitans sp. 2KL-17 TaxID=1100704 RepID=UPI000D37D29E|nr:tetraacyldisaccharide 4'-kinase [Limnohabitans sp. 2KL-17]PUE57936.1 tetraacyldisaccharide 4'-kinase [Limnohabitans sp. 2KL-17]